MLIDNGGFVYAGGQYGASEGITLRDDLARRAMPMQVGRMLDEATYEPKAIAVECYKLADAMIAESRVIKAEVETADPGRLKAEDILQLTALVRDVRHHHRTSNAIDALVNKLTALELIAPEPPPTPQVLSDDDIPF